mgnify:CR=1 FL=1
MSDITESRKVSMPKTFVERVEYEGGVIGTLERAFTPEDYDETAVELRLAWRALEAAWDRFRLPLEYVESLLADDED